MYPNPSATAGQWSPNGPPPQIPTPQPNNPNNNQWPQHHPQQTNGQYAQRPPQNQIPPISQALPQGPPSMTTLQPQHPDQYRSLPPPPMYGHPQYHPQPPLPYPPQPAPRQRTAIACRYCRRRKIRCSGFDHSEDGRCTNCQRFSQECVFTPVSAQTQAFVPAHTVWRNQGAPPQQLYGAYGQPLPQQYPSQQQQAQQQQHPYPPQGAPYQGQPMYPMPPNGAPSQGAHPNVAPPQAATPQPQEVAGRKRPTDEPHTPTLPPPNPANAAQILHRTSTGESVHYTYPDPTGVTPTAASPASSTASYHSTHPPAQPYYQPQPPPRRPSPQSYSYDTSRASSSPHNLATSSTPGSYPTPQPATSNPSQPPQAGRSSPPSGQAQAARGVRINELVGPSGQQQEQPPPSQQQGQQQGQAQQASQQTSQQQSQAAQDGSRSAADSDMLNQLNKQRM
ncbi:hypothetical protein BDV97DRAFT_399349 [Delphinella strobiligena]|nr:hypothetical protein BDV97DRAFT_399349 [Delphinella strobiligena]